MRMSKNNDNKLVPKLRFPEFEKDGEWERNRLDEIAEFLKGKGISKADINEKGVLPCIRYGELYTYYSEVINEIKSFTNISPEDLLLSEENDVIIPSSGETKEDIATASCVKLKGVALGGDLNVLRSELDGEFLAYYLSHGLKKAISKIAQGDAVVHLYSNQLKKLNVCTPRIKKEQQKIAACLSSLDEVLAAESQKLELLQDHKKGLLQNLLPQEGETVPAFRFKEFEGSGEWEETRLDEICKFIRGPFGGALKKEIFVPAGYAVYEQSHAIYADFTSFRYFITEEKYNELKRFAVQSNDIIMSCSGTMGKFAIVPAHTKKGVINQALLKLTVKMGYDTEFIKASLELPLNQNKLLSQSAGGAIKNVVEVAQIKEIKLSMPSLTEQQKIASCLSSIDELINAQSQKVETLKLHKKGLLQGLFPDVNTASE
jgi:type I restriction enzyme, S subunit